MNNKLINREIRTLSNYSSLPLLCFVILSQVSSYFVYFIFDLLKGTALYDDYGFKMLISYCVIYLVVMPLILLIFGGLVLFVLAAIMLPVFDIYSAYASM